MCMSGLEREDLGRVANRIDRIVAKTELPQGTRVNLRGMVQGMRESMRSFAIGLGLAVVLLYLILVAQFRSFMDPLPHPAGRAARADGRADRALPGVRH